MADWVKTLLQKPRRSPKTSRSHLNRASANAPSPPPVRSSSSPANSSVLSPSHIGVGSANSARWTKLYDVCICHSEEDLSFVDELVSYLESQPEHFRCFLQLRDATPGGAVVTELCDAVQNSHCWVLLITPNFLKDPWCRYQMHHALSEAPMANGRTIPVLKGVERQDYPRELRCIYYISVVLPETSFRQIKETVTRYLLDLGQTTDRRD
uniref:TIR domain containing adaptor protein n=1 Tax=Salvator merianae TaxID=96440 RepID=A0A8D0BRU0_SALMN